MSTTPPGSQTQNAGESGSTLTITPPDGKAAESKAANPSASQPATFGRIQFQIEFDASVKKGTREMETRVPPAAMIANAFMPGKAYRGRARITRLTSGLGLTAAESGPRGIPDSIPGQIMAIDTGRKLQPAQEPGKYISGPIMILDGLSNPANLDTLSTLNDSWKEAHGVEIKPLPVEVYNLTDSQLKTQIYFAKRCVDSNLATFVPESGKMPTEAEIDALPGNYLLGRGKLSSFSKLSDAILAGQQALI